MIPDLSELSEGLAEYIEHELIDFVTMNILEQTGRSCVPFSRNHCVICFYIYQNIYCLLKIYMSGDEDWCAAVTIDTSKHTCVLWNMPI